MSDPPLKRATRSAPAGAWPAGQAIDTVTLTYDDRHRRRVRLTTDGGTDVLLDLPRAAILGDGDGLHLDGSGWIGVHAAVEDVIEVTADAPDDLARFAWHIGNRHCPAQVQGGRILIRADHVMAEMLRGLGAVLQPRRAPFTPESGAYAGGHGHSHSHQET
jgi:urease accessory protein